MTSPDPTLAERSARFRARKAGKQPKVPNCPTCGRPVHKRRAGGICQPCWMKTPEGREYQRLRVAAYRAKQRAQNR